MKEGHIQGRGPFLKLEEVRYRIDSLVKWRKGRYEQSQKIKLLADDGDRHFFKNARNYQSKEKPAPFDVRVLYPGMTDVEVASELAAHFNSISNEFHPLEEGDIPLSLIHI